MDHSNEAAASARRKALGAFIRALRGDRTQAQLGKLLGDISQAAISAWENGLVELTCEQVRQIDVALGVRPGTLGLAAGYVELQTGEASALSPPAVSLAPPAEGIARHWFHQLEDAMEAVDAADTLSLGVHLWNLEVSAADTDRTELRWAVEISAEVPCELDDEPGTGGQADGGSSWPAPAPAPC